MLIDILMPKMDGTSMAKQMKEKGIETQKIFLTNFKDPEHMSKAMESAGGEVEYIVKSDVHVDNLVKRVRQKLGI
jgi:YesN/AraC family two-component response regulator